MKSKGNLSGVFWLGLAGTVLMAFLNIIHVTAIDWWVVFYPVLIALSYGFIVIIATTKAVTFIMNGRLSGRK